MLIIVNDIIGNDIIHVENDHQYHPSMKYVKDIQRLNTLEVWR